LDDSTPHIGAEERGRDIAVMQIKEGGREGLELLAGLRGKIHNLPVVSMKPPEEKDRET
jgi:hypothetical protein